MHEDAEQRAQALSKLKRGRSAEMEDAGLSNPDLGQKECRASFGPRQETPAKYRYSEAVADSADHASINSDSCL